MARTPDELALLAQDVQAHPEAFLPTGEAILTDMPPDLAAAVSAYTSGPVLYADLTHPVIDVPVVRAIAPGLERPDAVASALLKGPWL